MKKLVIITILLNSIITFSQNKTIVPKNGTIVFIKESVITDSIALNKSMIDFKVKFLEELKKTIIFERLSEGKKVDSLELNLGIKIIEDNFESLFNMMFLDSKKIKYVNNFFVDKIYSHKFVNDKNISTIFYDINSKMVYNDFNKKEIEDFYNENILNLKEYRNERKIVGGYNCFKIVYEYNESHVDDFYSNIFKYRRELWVTEEVDIPFLSIIKEKEILLNYFPIEITEFINGIEGYKTVYTSEIINLK